MRDFDSGNQQFKFLDSLRLMLGPWLRLGFFCLGLAVAARGQLAFVHKEAKEGLYFWALAGAITMLSLIGARPAFGPRDPLEITKKESPVPTSRWRSLLISALPILLILAAAYPALYWHILEMPPGPMHDETQAAIYGLNRLTGVDISPWWAPSMDSQPGIYPTFIAHVFQWLGPTLKTFRYSNVTWTLFTAFILYFLVRPAAGKVLAVGVAILFLHNPWVVHLSRWGYSMSWSMFGTALTIAGIAAALWRVEERLPPSPLHPSRWWPYAMAGFGMLFAQYGYVSGRLVIPAVFATFLIAYIARQHFLRENWPGLLAFVVIATVTALPWCWALQEQSGLITKRVAALGIHQDIFEEQSLHPLYSNILAHIKIFNYEGDFAPVNNLVGRPLLPVLVAPVTAMGLILSLYYWRALVPMLPLLWLGILLLSGILSRWIEVPKSHRILTTAPVLFFAAALWLAQGRQLLQAALNRTWKPLSKLIQVVVGLLFVFWIALHAYLQYFSYFVDQRNATGTYYVFTPMESLLEKTFRAAEPRYPVVLDDYFWTSQMRFMAYFDSWIHHAWPTATNIANQLPPDGPSRLYVRSQLEPFLNLLACAVGSEVSVVTDPISKDRWWAETLIPDSAMARQILTTHQELFPVDFKVNKLPSQTPAMPSSLAGTVYQGSTENQPFVVDLGTVTSPDVQSVLEVQISAVPGKGSLYDYLEVIGPNGQIHRYEAEDSIVTTGDQPTSALLMDEHWSLQELPSYSGGKALVALKCDKPPSLFIRVPIQQGLSLIHLGSFSGNSLDGAFAIRVSLQIR